MHHRKLWHSANSCFSKKLPKLKINQPDVGVTGNEHTMRDKADKTKWPTTHASDDAFSLVYYPLQEQRLLWDSPHAGSGYCAKAEWTTVQWRTARIHNISIDGCQLACGSASYGHVLPHQDVVNMHSLLTIVTGIRAVSSPVVFEAHGSNRVINVEAVIKTEAKAFYRTVWMHAVAL